MDAEKIRREFEECYQVPEGVAWNPDMKQYVLFHEKKCSKAAHSAFVAMWNCWNSAWHASRKALEHTKEDECNHQSISPAYDHLFCNECGMIYTGKGWGVASRMWFKSISHAKFYEKNGRLPE